MGKALETVHHNSVAQSLRSYESQISVAFGKEIFSGQLPSPEVVDADVGDPSHSTVAVSKYEGNGIVFLDLTDIFVKGADKNSSGNLPGFQTIVDLRIIPDKVEHKVIAVFLYFPGQLSAKVAVIGIHQRIWGVRLIRQHDGHQF